VIYSKVLFNDFMRLRRKMAFFEFLSRGPSFYIHIHSFLEIDKGVLKNSKVLYLLYIYIYIYNIYIYYILTLLGSGKILLSKLLKTTQNYSKEPAIFA